ncbi:MAG: ABC transporter ATP-binding protein [candidate division Zixibacteria bacterium]|nr:ABC transporter ATP-binding protein [candidate division Zixibacteria bacterium]
MSAEPISSENVISLRGVGVRFYRRSGLFRQSLFTALHDISFDLQMGESLGIIGRNGSGKSTLIRVLAGIIEPDSGVCINHGYSTALLSMGIGFDKMLSGRHNAILNGLLLGFRKRDVVNRMSDIIAFAELDDFIDHPLYTYSSGMRARLGFSVALKLDPDILLVDEALGVGDAQFKAKSSEVMQQKIQSNRTAVLVSHSTDVIRKLCQRTVWIDHGELCGMGPTDEVLSKYHRFLKIEPS